MAPIPLRNMLVLWAQLVSMSESRQVGSWRGACLHPPQVRNAELLPALMWVRVARLAWALGLVPTFCSAEQDVRSPCNRFLSRGRLVSICLLEFQVSRLPWPNEDSARSIPQAPSRRRGDFDKAERFGASHQRTFDEILSEIAGQTWIVAPAGHFVSRIEFRADGSREDTSGEADGQSHQALERLRQRHQEILQ